MGRFKQREIGSWQEAEQNAAELMRSWGFKRVRVTQGGADQGIDVKANGAVAQVKHYRQPVGRPDLQRFVGAAGQSQMIFFALSGYTNLARDYAQQHKIALFQYTFSGAPIPVNSAARSLKSQGFDLLDRSLFRLAPGLKPYAVRQPILWNLTVVCICGTFVLPPLTNDRFGFVWAALVAVGLAVVGLIGACLLASQDESPETKIATPLTSESKLTLTTSTAIEADQSADNRSAPEAAAHEVAGEDESVLSFWPSAITGLVLAAAPLVALPWIGDGWWWLLLGVAWCICWLSALGLWSECVPSNRGEAPLWPNFVLTLVLVVSPLAAIPWNEGGWWWLPHGIGWLICWRLAFETLTAIFGTPDLDENAAVYEDRRSLK